MTCGSLKDKDSRALFVTLRPGAQSFDLLMCTLIVTITDNNLENGPNNNKKLTEMMNFWNVLPTHLILVVALFPVVRGSPSLTIQPSVVWENSEILPQVTLTCDPGMAGDFNVTWLKDDQDYPQTRADLTLTLQTYTVAGEDGNWQCRITSDSGISTSNGRSLTINSYPVNTPVLQPINVTVSMVDNGSKIADCVFKSKPDNSLTWLIDDDQPLPDILTMSSGGVFKMDKYFVRTSTLSWKAGVEDLEKTKTNKLFKCVSRINNMANSMRTGYQEVTVLYTPVEIDLTGALTTEIVTESGQVSRTCQANCYPDCTYQWRDSYERKYDSGTRLELTNVTKLSALLYTCTASNGLGLLEIVFNLTVEYAPMDMYLTYEPASPKQGDNVTVTCLLDSHPGSVISLHNVSIDTPAWTEQVNVLSTQHTISDIECHTMEIWCRAHNRVNDILPKPHLTKNRTIVTRCAPQIYYTNVESGVLTMSREKSDEILVGILASPFPSLAQTSWTFSGDADDGPDGDQGDRLPDNARVGVVVGNILSLTILEAGNQNVGQYTLTAWNNMGQVNFTVTLVLEDGFNYGLVIGSATGGGILLIIVIIVVVLVARNVIPRDCKKQTRQDAPTPRHDETGEDAPAPKHDEPDIIQLSPARQFNVYQPQGASTRRPSASGSQRQTMDVDTETPTTSNQEIYVNSTVINEPSLRVAKKPPTMNLANKLKEALEARSNPPEAQKAQKPPEAQKPPKAQKPPEAQKPLKAQKPPTAVKGSKNIKMLQTSDIALKELLLHGSFFSIQRCEAGRTSGIPPDDQLVAKKALETTGPMGNIYWDFLRSQAETLSRLEGTGQVVHCYGLIYDSRQRLMVMSRATKGSVREYLKNSREFRQNSEERKVNELRDIVHQTVSGLVAISNLQASDPVLHYCLNADHVLITHSNLCQVTGFASGRLVQNREAWEHENNHTRPLRWLAPEAIQLNHKVESDVWSLGVLMWEIYNLGRMPHGHVPDDEVAAVVESGTRLKKPAKYSKDMYNLMVKCWWMDPKQRAKLSDIYSELPCPSPDYMNMTNRRMYVNINT